MAHHIAEVLFTVLEVLIAVACCLGNLPVIWAVWKCGAMRRQATFCFIISLAIADVLVGAVAVPLRVVADSRVQMSFYSCLTLTCMILIVTRVSVFFQLALTVDRFLRVIIPLRYKTTVTIQRSWWVVAACWLTAATVGFTPLMGWNNHNGTSQNMTHCQFLNVMSMSYLVTYFYICFLIPMLVMTTLYGCIFTIIHRQLRKTSTGVSSSYYYKERNLTRSLVLVLVLFAVCWLPIHLMDMADFHGLAVPIEAVYVGILLSQASSAINPIIYAFKIQHIRAPLKTIWRKVFLCKEEVEAPRSSQTPGFDKSSNPKDTTCDKEGETVESTEQG
ncbi:adenosine receptor A1-like [Alosa pseudoharengus]|uniref:adenosine receptor A1-like n=1 Tax=Alosa pseudoharengus TaxID=34774 RepID=UPI003F8A78E3